MKTSMLSTCTWTSTICADRIGQSVTITAELTEVKDNKVRYSVSAINDQGI